MVPDPTCPICNKRFARVEKTYPFCTERCRAADLGAWLGESYRVQAAPSEEDADALMHALFAQDAPEA